MTCRRPQILIVDDSPLMLSMMSLQLEQLGFVALAAQSGEEALRIAASNAIDAAILDAEMSGMSAVEVAQAIDAAIPSLPLVVHTGLTEPELRLTFMAYDSFLPKPCSMKSLAACLEQLLATSGDDLPLS